MSILKIAQLGHPILRGIAQPVAPDEITGEEIQRLLEDMRETMIECDGVGLAAPQVHVGLQVAVLEMENPNPRYPDRESFEPMVLINPKITPMGEKTAGMYEGCLSIPGIRGWVDRPSQIHVEAYDEEGEGIEFDAEGFTAIVIQHECDHLLGRLFVDLADTRRLYFEKEYDRYAEDNE